MIDPSRKLRASAITILLPLSLCALLMLAAERPLWRFGPRPASGSPRRAAVALRDNVIPFQKWGTRVFTLPYLERYYDAAFYFTESSDDTAHQAFIASLTQALSEYDSVDVYLLAHSNYYIDWVATIDPSLRSRLRLVYNTGCYDAAQAEAWLQLGARTAVAHPGISDSPVFYFYFLRRWTLGAPLDQAVAASNARMRESFELLSIATLGQFHSSYRFANSQAQCFGDCGITIGGN